MNTTPKARALARIADAVEELVDMVRAALVVPEADAEKVRRQAADS